MRVKMDGNFETFGIPRKPWIPPPGKASRTKKSSIPKSGELVDNDKDITKKPSSSSSKEMQTYLDTSMITLPEFSRNMPDFSSNFNQPLPSGSSNDMKIEEIYLHLQDLKDDSANLQSTRNTFREILDFFQRPTFVSIVEDLSINQMISHSNCFINQFFDVCNKFENYIASSDLIPRCDTAKLIAHINTTRICKKKLYAKLLQTYDYVTSTLRFTIEVMQKEHFSSLFKDHDDLKFRLETLQNSFLDREAKIKQMEYELRYSKQKIKLLEKEKSSSEISPYYLEKSQPQASVRSGLHTYKPDPKLIAENASLLKAYTDTKKMSDSEISALRKALTMHISSLDHYRSTTSQLQEKLNEKEQELFKLGLERDDWKSKLTNSNNKLVESEGQLEHFKKINEDLLKELDTLKESHKAKLTQMEAIVNENSLLLDVVTSEKTKLNESLSHAEENFLTSQKEIKMLQEKCTNLEAQNNGAKNKKTDSESEVHLIPLLQDLNDSLTVVREKGFSHLKESSKPENRPFSEEKLLDLVKEIKNLIESKEIHQNSVEQNMTNQQIASVENKLQGLQIKCNQEIADKERRLQQIQEQIKSAEDKYLTLKHMTFETDTNAMTVENINSREVANLKDELKKKSHELTKLKRKQYEDKNKFESEIKDLNGKLNRMSTNYESLQRYVNLLKTSYTNLFNP